MTAGEFFFDRLGRIAFEAVCILAFAAFLLATGTQSGVVILLLITGLFIFLFLHLSEFWIAKKRLNELEAVMKSLDKRYLFAECAPRPRSLYESKLFGLLRLSGKSMIETVSDAEAEQKEYREYVEQWVHEIKTPITAAKLICQSLDGDTRRKLSRELDQIDAHVERALYYARAESPEKDFIIRKTELAEICESAVETHRSLLIQNGVHVEMDGLTETVYTDSKWAVFMLGQLLQNAARYHGEMPEIILSAKTLGKQVRLTVRDNGIGIPEHELPRVFDRGFTGSNGRSRGGSTGMGLYLCRRLADALEIDLCIRSKEGDGTCAALTFPAKEHFISPAEENLSKM